MNSEIEENKQTNHLWFVREQKNNSENRFGDHIKQLVVESVNIVHFGIILPESKPP